jgi:hypothetical protein
MDCTEVNKENPMVYPCNPLFFSVKSVYKDE